MPEYLHTPSGSEIGFAKFYRFAKVEGRVPEYLHTPSGSEIDLLSFILLSFKELYG